MTVSFTVYFTEPSQYNADLTGELFFLACLNPPQALSFILYPLTSNLKPLSAAGAFLSPLPMRMPADRLDIQIKKLYIFLKCLTNKRSLICNR